MAPNGGEKKTKKTSSKGLALGKKEIRGRGELLLVEQPRTSPSLKVAADILQKPLILGPSGGSQNLKTWGETGGRLGVGEETFSAKLGDEVSRTKKERARGKFPNAEDAT